MNLLIHNPPTELEIDGKKYPINAHYRNCLVILSAFEDKRLTQQEQFQIMLKRLYKEIPPNIESALLAAVDFLDCGEELKSGKDGRLYSFSQDSRYIYSAIEKSHRINLEEVGFLHWWKFVNKFFDLNEDCFFNQLIMLRRKRNRNEKLTKEERKYIAENPELFNLSTQESTEDQEFEDEITERIKAAAAKRDS